MRWLAALLFTLLIAGSAQAFGYSTGGCATGGCAAGESWLFSNANELDTGIDNVESSITTLSGITFITQTSSGALSGEQAMGLLTTGIVINTTTTGVQSIYAGTSCTNQFLRSLDASGAGTCATVGDSDLNAAITRDSESTNFCISKQLIAPSGGKVIGIYGVPFASTLTRYRMYLEPTTEGETTTATVRECTAGQQSCGNSDSQYTANSDGATWDTTFSDANVAADANVIVLVNTPSGDLSGASLNIDLCYTRQVVQ